MIVIYSPRTSCGSVTIELLFILFPEIVTIQDPVEIMSRRNKLNKTSKWIQAVQGMGRNRYKLVHPSPISWSIEC